MRILHTADWHAGKTIGAGSVRRSRTDELRAVLAEIVTIAERESVQAVVIAGDVFDTKSPPPEAEDAVFQALLELERRGMHLVIISGNHDHPDRWRALRPLLQRFQTHVVPGVARPDRGGIIRIPGVGGGADLQVAALPWVPLRRVVDAATMMSETVSEHARYADGVGAILRALGAALDPNACTVLAAHLTVNGALAGGGERSLTLGNVYAIEPLALPQVQYVALGHVHRPQTIQGTGVPARYAGSPLQLDFGEVGYRPSVTVVDLEPGTPAQVREIPLSAGRRLVDVHGTLDQLEARAGELADSWLRVTLRCDRPSPGLGESVVAVLPSALEVRLDYPRASVEGERPAVRTLTAREQFARYMSERQGATVGEGDLDLFEELVLEAEGESN